MTEDQKKNFLLYGCMSRALMKICDLTSIEDFCTSYDKYFRTQYYGMPETNKINVILNDLGYEWIRDTDDYQAVLDHCKKGGSVIVCSHVSLNENDSSELNHASVLDNATDSEFCLWTSFQNGKSGVLPKFERKRWKEKKCHGLLIQTKSNQGKTK